MKKLGFVVLATISLILFAIGAKLLLGLGMGISEHKKSIMSLLKILRVLKNYI